MMKCIIPFLLFMIFILSCTQQNSGIEVRNFDTKVQLKDDFYQYVNGNWLKKTKIPTDKSNFGAFSEVADKVESNLRMIIEEVANAPDKEPNSDEQKVGDFYFSFMDTSIVEKLGLLPLAGDLNRINGITSKRDLIALFAYFSKQYIQLPFNFWVDQDLKNSEMYIFYLNQSGLALPDRDYYFNQGEKFKEIRKKYMVHIRDIFDLANIEYSQVKAKRIIDIETEIAKNHWTAVQNRDRENTYNKYKINSLVELTPDFDWNFYFNTIGLSSMEEVIVRQPSYFEAFNKMIITCSIEDWKTYLTFKLIDGNASLLNKNFVDLNFEFYSKTLSGIKKIRPRWKRAVTAIENCMGELVGKVYVKRHFKPEAKKRMVQLVDNLKLAYNDRIQSLVWMGPETKEEALKKLYKFKAKIGYPDKWKDYSKLVINKQELIQNYIRAAQVEFERTVAKLGSPVDRDEWLITPQTVNAFYDPTMNEVIFPAAILQAPFFNMETDDAVNYGAIGAAIGHEMTHGFDDQGRRSDGDGNLRDWWTKEDEKKFMERAQVLIEQFESYNPVDTMHLNGQLTLGENIADLGGLTIAYYAYKKSLQGNESPIIEGMTGEQRFFFGWAQIWRRKYRDEELRKRVLTDPHSPGKYRVLGVLSNMPEFYEAFNITENDNMYRSSEVRVQIW